MKNKWRMTPNPAIHAIHTGSATQPSSSDAVGANLPSIFDILAQESLAASMKPGLRNLVQVYYSFLVGSRCTRLLRFIKFQTFWIYFKFFYHHKINSALNGFLKCIQYHIFWRKVLLGKFALKHSEHISSSHYGVKFFWNIFAFPLNFFFGFCSPPWESKIPHGRAKSKFAPPPLIFHHICTQLTAKTF